MKNLSIHNLRVFQTEDALDIAATEFIITIANKAIVERGKFIISLSGGQTPVKLYTLLANPPFKELINWEKTFVFWSDERCVPLNDERNNALMAKEALLNKINIPESNIHPIPVDLPPEKAAANYEKELNLFFGDASPRFDLILLGLGENGHTASLFPDTNVIDEKTEGIREVYVEEEKMFRITMTAPLINQARAILFLVIGKNKAAILKKVLSIPYQPAKIPAQIINPIDGKLYWYVDDTAASLL